MLGFSIFGGWDRIMAEMVFEKIPGGHWSPVFTLTRNEKKVFSSLSAKGVPVYLPMKRHVNIQPVISRGRNYSYKRILHVPMFANYLFAHITPEVQTELNWDRSVVRILKTDDYQEEGLLEELRLIRELERFSEAEEIDVTNGLKQGTRVVFTDGSFAGWEGVVASVEPDGMAYINIVSIGSSVRIKYPAAWCQVC